MVLGPFFFFQGEDGIRDDLMTGVQTCAVPLAGVSPVLSSLRSNCWSTWRANFGQFSLMRVISDAAETVMKSLLVQGREKAGDARRVRNLDPGWMNSTSAVCLTAARWRRPRGTARGRCLSRARTAARSAPAIRRDRLAAPASQRSLPPGSLPVPRVAH